MDPRHAPDPPRRSPFDWRGHLHAWAAEITAELTELWCPPPPALRAYLRELLGFTPSCWQGDVPPHQPVPIIRTR